MSESYSQLDTRRCFGLVSDSTYQPNVSVCDELGNQLSYKFEL